ncbi:MAG: VOC family protein [Proteobacteria bacterium]|nr:VOC family protein [Pseudomonadota bacterium]
MQKITPFLWFDGQAEEAMNFYMSIFKKSKAAEGSKAFELDGVEFIAFDGGPHFKFNEAISLYVNCESQEEVDYFWDRLGAGGAPGRCGWLKDKFGVSWQVVPDALPRLLKDPDRAKANRVMQAMMKMQKIVVADLEASARG